MASIEFEHVTKRYKDGFEAVRDMSLEVRDGEFMIPVGPSGSGKSTALRMVRLARPSRAKALAPPPAPRADDRLGQRAPAGA